MVRAVLFAALLLSASACNHSADPGSTPATGSATGPVGDTHAGSAADPTLDQDLGKLAKLSVAMYKDIASAFTVAGADCKAATVKLGELATTYRDVPIANAKVLRDHRAKEMRAALAPLQADLDAAGQSIAQSKTLAACSSDKQFEEAFDKLEAPP